MSPDRAIENLRIPPHSIEAEQAVLGGLLLSNAALDRIGDLIGEADFYRHDHRVVWRCIARLVDANQPADVLTVAEALKGAGELQDVGGLTYVHQLANGTPSAANIRRYAEIVRERSIQRAVIAAATALLEEAYVVRPAEELIERAQSIVVGLGVSPTARGESSMAAVLSRVMCEVHARHRGEERRIATGLPDLDRLLHGGLRGGRLYVLAGRPSSGKSALALQIALQAALAGHAAMVASLEMADEENGERALAAVAKVPLDSVITGNLEPEHWERMGAALGQLNEAPIFFDDTPAVCLGQLRARVRRLKQKRGIQLLVVDYLQLMHTDARGENRNTEVTEIAEGLKALAKELGIAVIALSQMNRDCEKRTNRRGVIADLRDSGGIDAAADFIAFIYRDELYNEDTPDKGVAEIIVRKARQGRVGTVYTLFRGEFQRFESMAPGFRPAALERPPQPSRRSFSGAC